jgi:hypothetical protein
MAKPRPSRANRELVLKALTDPTYRKLLETNPKAALGGAKLSKVNKQEIALVLATVKGIRAQISAVGDELLCANGGCGIAVG